MANCERDDVALLNKSKQLLAQLVSFSEQAMQDSADLAAEATQLKREREHPHVRPARAHRPA